MHPPLKSGFAIAHPTNSSTLRAAKSTENIRQTPKPDFNDLVVHQGYLYGFDNAIFACVDLKDGRQTWKGGRYGKGQVLLLADSDLLIVLSEKGELVLLKASPDSMEELAKIAAMDGKTWNHPVVVGERLYVRNAEEAVCYQLPLR